MCLSGLAAAAGCLAGGDVVDRVLELTDVGDDEVGTTDPDDPTGCTTNTVFLNFGGGQYTSGADDARTGRSSILSALGLASATMTQVVSASGQSSLQQCLDQQFAPYAVNFTTTRPPATCGYREIAIGRADPALRQKMAERGEAVGMAPKPWNCTPTLNAIAIVDAELADAVPTTGVRALCAATAHEIGHVFGLRHLPTPNTSLGPGDIMMERMRNRNVAGFRDMDEWCTTCVRDSPNPNAPNQCRPDKKQNSHRRLLEVLGARQGGGGGGGGGGEGECDGSVDCDPYAGCPGGGMLCTDRCTGHQWCTSGGGDGDGSDCEPMAAVCDVHEDCCSGNCEYGVCW
jgi:hypothetical protein